MAPEIPTDQQERSDLLAALQQQRKFLRYTVHGLSDEEATQLPTVSELCLGGLIKHVASMERQWVEFIERGPDTIGVFDEHAVQAHVMSFQVLEGETLQTLLGLYDEVADRTDQVVRRLPTLDVSHPLPVAPWFEAGASWTARRTLLHVIAETAQHAGHADIIREAIDGQKTMG